MHTNLPIFFVHQDEKKKIARAQTGQAWNMRAESPSSAVPPLGYSNMHADSPLIIKLHSRTKTSCFTPVGLTGLLLSPPLQNETHKASSEHRSG